MVLSTVLHTAVGGVVKLSTTAWQVFVQPVSVLVTVTVYVPAPNPLIIDVVDPVLHAYVTSVAVAVALPFNGVQLALSTLLQVTSGGVAFVTTKASHVFVQPVVVFVTVTVYVPASKLLIVAVVPPVLHKY